MYCSTATPDWKSYRLTHTPEYWNNLRANRNDDILYIDVRWVVLYSKAEEKIAVERVRDCHKMLNTIYGGRNADELAKVPNTERCPFKSLIGNPQIQFLPLDERQVKVTYKKTEATLDRSNPVKDAADRAGVVDGSLNIYVGNSGGGLTLGQATIGGNVVYGLYSTIGGYSIPGTLSGYSQGKTIAHEVAHALGLHHTFQDNLCDHFPVYTDVPEQIKPNFGVELVEISPGVWDQKGDNRSRDRELQTNTSCLHIQSDPQAAPNEMGVNLMDYNRDEVSLMFTQNQVDEMRARLLSADNNTLVLRTSNFTRQSSDMQPDYTGQVWLGVLILTLVVVIALGGVTWYARKQRQTAKVDSKAPKDSNKSTVT